MLSKTIPKDRVRKCRTCGKNCTGTQCRSCFEKKGTPISRLNSINKWRNKNDYKTNE